MNELIQSSTLVVRQRKELAELFGFETRNKYEICDQSGRPVAYCAEQNKGLLQFLFRQFLGHWRTFELHFFDHQKQVLWVARHPFRFFFQRLEIFTPQGKPLGALQQRWGIFKKKFTVESADGREILQMESGFFSFWTFPISRSGKDVAVVRKKWSGLLKEMFTDSDNFTVEFQGQLSPEERQLVISAAIFVDLQYFEHKAND